MEAGRTTLYIALRGFVDDENSPAFRAVVELGRVVFGKLSKPFLVKRVGRVLGEDLTYA